VCSTAASVPSLQRGRAWPISLLAHLGQGQLFALQPASVSFG